MGVGDLPSKKFASVQKKCSQLRGRPRVHPLKSPRHCFKTAYTVPTDHWTAQLTFPDGGTLPAEPSCTDRSSSS